LILFLYSNLDLISGGANSIVDPYAFDLGGGGKSTNMIASD